jgi:hypothetical protein
VEIAFSIDDVGERFEYQRTNAKWQEVCANMDRFRDLREIHSNIELQICTTVNVFNIHYLDQVADWIYCNRQGFNFVYWNIMHDAWYFSVATLPESAKISVAKHLRTAAVPDIYREEFDGIVDFMLKGASTDGNMLRMKIADLDRKRQQNFATVAPEMAELIDYDFKT